MKSSSPIPLVVSFVLLAVACVGYFFWYGQISALSSRAATLSAELSAKKDDAARLVAANATLAAIASDTESINSYFVASDSVVPFLEELQATGKSFGAKVDIASVSADLKSATPHLTLALKIEGPFDAVMRTLGTYEFSPRDMMANDLSLTSSGSGTWAATGSFIVGSRVAKKQAAATPTP